MKENQVPDNFKKIINDQVSIFKEKVTVQEFNKIPETSKIPIENKSHWLKIKGVICVFVDMKGSTKLSATKYDKSTANIYQLFTETAVKMFNEFGSPYIDIKGDGVFALFDDGFEHKALCSAITFKSFCDEDIVPKIKNKHGVEISAHIGIDKKDLLVRKVGFKRFKDRSDRQNEVWAGKTVNMASKLAQLGKTSEVYVSDRFFQKIKDEKALKSCGCPNDEVVDLWQETNVEENESFDFDSAYFLTSNWCGVHGKETLSHLLSIEND